MSGILGVWNLDGAPISREMLASMSLRLSHRGAEGEFVWTSADVGLVTQMMRSTPESLGEVQPLAHGSGVVLVYDGRLDNRTELLQALPPSEGLSAHAPDTVFILAAYLEWGERFLEHLTGEFAIGLWDGRSRTLVLGRDPMGSRPLYYWRGPDGFLFASEIKALLAHPAG
jgi:asparagine synthase (glutamine-hydrolysing)